LDIIGGTAQMAGVDFTSNGFNTVISWAGKPGLDGTMASGDQVRVIFDRS